MGPIIVVANEKTNWESSRSKIRRAREFLRQHGFGCSWFTTEGPGHARELAAAAAVQDVETIVAIGGDGTVNEVINGLLASGRESLPRIGVVPAGCSNDFSKSLGIPQDVHQACRAIVGGRVRPVDIGRAGSRYFCSASCLGYFAEIAAVSDRMKGLRGSARYVVAALTVIRTMKSGWKMEVIADGQTFRGEYAVLLVGNAPRFGGLTMIPGARMDDGVLDCLLIEMAGKLEALHLIALVYRKAIERHKRVTRFQTTSLSVCLNRPVGLCHDGEVCSGAVEAINYAVLPKRLRVIC